MIAVQNLARQSFQCFCPRIHATRKHARRTESIFVPMFPGYVFVNFEVERGGWRSINGTFGVRRLLCFELATPVPMPEDAMASLLENYGEAPRRLRDFQAGDSVVIIAGPFAEQYAKVESLDGKGRVSLLFDILGGAARVSMEADSLAPADR